MKKIGLFYIVFSFTISIFANNLQDSLYKIVEQGNQFYQRGKYTEAIESYLQVVESKFESSNLYYNLGNAFYKNNEFGKSILWYERALLLNPSNDDIKHNIAFVNQKLEDKIDVLPKLFITEWYDSISATLTSNQWAMLSIIACILVVLSILGTLFLRFSWGKSVSFIVGICFLICCIFSIHFAYKNNKSMENNPEAIVMKSVLTGKSTPSESGTDLFVIHEGLKVSITDQLNDWIEIKLPNGEKGWVEYSDIERITIH